MRSMLPPSDLLWDAAMRFRVLDFYRFCAAILVMGYHYFASFNAWFSGASPYVDFFFMLSGFVIMRGYGSRVANREERVTFLVARFARIYPLHFATTSFWLLLVGCVSLGLLHLEHPIAFNARELLQQYLLIQAWDTTNNLTLNVPSWSISAEWGVYLLFPLFVAIWLRFGAIAIGAIALAAILALEAVSYYGLLGDRPWTEWTWDFGVLRAVPSFMIGMWIASCADGSRISGIGIRTGVVLFALSVWLVYVGAPRLSILFDLALALFFTASGELRREKSWLAHRRLMVLGDASYAIYLLHMITLPICAVALRRLFHDSWPTLPVIMLVTVGLSIACHIGFERPAQKWIKLRWAALGAKTPSIVQA
jgi:peptidoglycan/LPS O-acetylase OafA/YrhL